VRDGVGLVSLVGVEDRKLQVWRHQGYFGLIGEVIGRQLIMCRLDRVRGAGGGRSFDLWSSWDERVFLFLGDVRAAGGPWMPSNTGRPQVVQRGAAGPRRFARAQMRGHVQGISG
jgi:hypothetical protein